MNPPSSPATAEISRGDFVAESDIEEVLKEPAPSFRERVFASKVFIIRQRRCNVSAFVALARRLGRPVNHVLENFSLPGLREVIRISNLYRNGAPLGVHDGGTYWHTDMSYKEDNTVFTALCAERVPKSGASGGTEFIDCESAYGLLKDAVRSGAASILPDGFDLDTAMVMHRFGNRERLANPQAAVQELRPDQMAEMGASVRHPLIVRHPATGRKSIYAVAATAMAIEGLSQQESIRVLDLLHDFLQTFAPRYTHRYRPGDIVVWDNLSTMHRGQQIGRSEDEDDCRMLYRMNLNYMSDSR